METLAGGPALIGGGVRLLKSGHAPHLYEMVEGNAERVTPQLMAQAAAAGDSFVRDYLLEAARMLGIGVFNVITMLNPELIVVGGDVAHDLGPLLIDTVRHEFENAPGCFRPTRFASRAQNSDRKQRFAVVSHWRSLA